MKPKLLKQLKEAGFPLQEDGYPREGKQHYFDPELTELIDACGDKFFQLQRMVQPVNKNIFWRAKASDKGKDWHMSIPGKTPEIAVAKLWLVLNKKSS